MLYVNDLSGDIDGLFATVHALLSPTLDLRGIICSGTPSKDETPQAAVALADEMLRLTGFASKVKVFEGAGHKLAAAGSPQPSAGTQAIIDEARRTDSKLPLYVAVGGGLTEVASAVMIAPDIAARLTLVWIGGDAYPAGGKDESNFNTDAFAAQYLFNDTRVAIWQIPRAVYASCVISDTELQAFVAPNGAIGRWLYDKIFTLSAKLGKYGLNTGETWTLGDSPLVVVTALTDWVPSMVPPPFEFERTGSSQFDEVIAPHLNPDGTFEVRTEGRKIRIYKSIDTRLMFSDFFAKLRINFGKD
jgi:purine nucleosidase